MNVLKDVRQAFERRGYQKMSEVESIGKGDIWYRHVSSTTSVVHVAYLSYKPSSKSYSVHIGAFNPAARDSVIGAMPSLSSFIAPIWLDDKFFLRRPCWHMFDAGRALGWDSIYVIPNPNDREGWSVLFESLFENFIEPIFFEIHNALGVQTLLLRDDPPFEWKYTSSIVRAAEVISLGRESGIDRSTLLERLDPCRSVISRNIYGEKRYEDMVEVLFDQLY